MISDEVDGDAKAKSTVFYGDLVMSDSMAGTVSAKILIALTLYSVLPAVGAESPKVPQKVSFGEYIRKSAVPREILDQWLRVPS